MKPQRNKRNSRKIDRAKVLDLAAQGMKPADIAKHQGVVRSTITRCLRQHRPAGQDIEAFRSERADLLARFQSKALRIQDRILDTFEDKAVIDELTAHQKNHTLQTLSMSLGVAYDKERLERGQSTANMAVLTKLIEEADAKLFPVRKPAKLGTHESSPRGA